MSTSTMHPLLAALEERAGASDQDREAWLAERRRGVTATEVRDLVLKGAAFKRELIDIKLGRSDDVADLSHIPVIGWGKHREPIIAEIVRERFAIAPESRVFRSATDPRWLASPDGIGVDFNGDLIVSEIKTAGRSIATSDPAFTEKGYLLQMQWVMHVLGARRCLYAWEGRVEVGPEEFEAGALAFEWIDYQPELAAKLERVAVEFLAELDASAKSGPAPVVVDDEVDTLAVNVLRGRELEAEGAALKSDSWKQLLEVLRGRGKEWSQKTTLAQVTFTPAGERSVEVPDVEAARAADLGLWEQLQVALAAADVARERWQEHQARFVRDGVEQVRERLTVTAGRGTRKAKA